MTQLPKSKYDKDGRPIKKGLFSNIELGNKYSNLDNSYTSKKYIKEDTHVDNYKSSLSQKYDKLEQKFKKENPDFDLKNEFGLDKVGSDFIGYFVSLFLGFMIPFIGFFVSLIVLLNLRNKKQKDYEKIYNIVKILAQILLVYSIVTGFMFVKIYWNIVR